jgi:hypothetical protein
MGGVCCDGDLICFCCGGCGFLLLRICNKIFGHLFCFVWVAKGHLPR